MRSRNNEQWYRYLSPQSLAIGSNFNSVFKDFTFYSTTTIPFYQKRTTLYADCNARALGSCTKRRISRPRKRRASCQRNGECCACDASNENSIGTTQSVELTSALHNLKFTEKSRQHEPIPSTISKPRHDGNSNL